MAILYRTDEATLLDCFVEARLLLETLSAMIPEAVRESTPRRAGTLYFDYREDGELNTIFLMPEKVTGGST